MRRTAGFTLAEVMVVTVISSFVFAGVLSAYIFLGRGLTREGNEQVLESRSRLTLYYFTQDVTSATAVTNAGATQLILTPPGGGSVTYTYDSTLGTLTRTAAAGPSSLLIGLSSFSFSYFNFGGTTPSPVPSGTTWIKSVNMAFTTVAGVAVSGAQSHLSIVSPQVLLKNKSYLQ